jgi:hypothetical protein
MEHTTTNKHTIKRTAWSVLPAPLEVAGRLAFPDCKSPRSVPDDKWNELVLAYITWHHILYSDGLSLTLLRCCNRSSDHNQKYLNDIALRIAGRSEE